MSSLLMDENLGGKGLTVPEALEGETVLQGWLVKRGSSVKNLKKRYFVLSKGRIDYYHDLEKMKAQYMELGHKGMFPLKNAAVVYSLPTYQLINGLNIENVKTSSKSGGGFFSKLVGGNEEEATDFGFCVRSQGKVLMLYASSKESMEAWIKGIIRCNVHDPEDTEFPIPAKEGFMIKQTGADAEKKLRYVVLQRGKMLYYEDSADDQVKVTLPLEDVRCAMMPGSDDNKKFMIATKSGAWFFEVLNNYEASHWVQEVMKNTVYSANWKAIHREGWMVKYGRKSDTTQTRRYFVLYSDSLVWYTDESLASELGRWPLRNTNTACESEERDGQPMFRLRNVEDALSVVAKNEEVKQVWIDHINEYIVNVEPDADVDEVAEGVSELSTAAPAEGPDADAPAQAEA